MRTCGIQIYLENAATFVRKQGKQCDRKLLQKIIFFYVDHIHFFSSKQVRQINSEIDMLRMYIKV